MLPLRYLPIAVYLPSTALAAVYIKVSFGDVTPFLVTFCTFAFCWLLFLVQNHARLPAVMRHVVAEPWTFLKINVLTLLSWLGAFACIQMLTGSVELLVFMSAIPFVSVVAGGEWARLGRVERGTVLAIFVCSLVVVLLHPTMQSYGIERQAWGLGVGVAAGVFGALYIVMSGKVQKRLALSSADLICARLPLLLLVTLALSYSEIGRVASQAFLGKAILLSLVAVVVPVFALQLSITRLGAVPTSVLMPLVPVLALLFEWGARITLTPAAVVAMTLQCAAIMWVSLVLARVRRGAAERDALSRTEAGERALAARSDAGGIGGVIPLLQRDA
jgi:drug/metabolite transporter (DMT)-like permease